MVDCMAHLHVLDRFFFQRKCSWIPAATITKVDQAPELGLLARTDLEYRI